MNQRTLFLLAGALAVAVLYGGDQGYRNWYEQPKQRLETQIDKLRKQKSEAEDRQVLAAQARSAAEKYVDYSLPYDPELARSAYQDWLLSLMAKHEMQNASVDAGQPRPIEIKRQTRKGELLVAHRIEFTVRTRASFEQFTAFLYDFYRAGHLHKIESLAMNPLAGGRTLDLTLDIEALSLQACDREGELAEATWDRLASETFQDYQWISRRNIFARGFSSSLANLRLTAVTVNRAGKAEAWFSLGPQSNTQIVSTGELLDIDVYELQVTEILPERVLLTLNGQPFWLGIGQRLGDQLESGEQTVSRTP